MAKVFLDTNYFVDALHRKPEQNILPSLEGHSNFISALSIHIYCYIFKIKIPNQKVSAQCDTFEIVEFSEHVLENALEGPTEDFEDNVQLHSAAAAGCDYFLTEDKKLLTMEFFGKVRIAPALEI